MKFQKVLPFILGIALFFSCKSDDALDIVEIPPRGLAEVEVENEAEIREYLETHFYNYEEFETPPADFDYVIDLDTLAGDNADKTPLMDQVTTLTINVKSEDFGLDGDESVDFTLYYLAAREGMGDSPTPADSTFLNYEGSLLDGTIFDATPTNTWQYLPFFLRGYSQTVASFKVGDDIIVNPDGTSEITNSGIGVMFLPSGLAYFSNPPSGLIPQYAVLIFKVNTGLFVELTDYDNDGIPSIMEDLNNDGDVTNDNTDLEEEQRVGSPAFPNHIDPDDDNDGTPTRDEISDEDGNIIIPYPDTDGDGTPDYLDIDS